MFPSKVELYNDNDLLGTDATTADDNFDTAHPLYRLIADLSKVRLGNPALTRGLTEVRNFDHDGHGLLAVERYDPETGRRVLVAFNTSGEAITRNVEIDYRASGIATLLGSCRAAVTAPGAVTLTIPAFGYVACELELPGGEG
jgi:glycosidase